MKEEYYRETSTRTYDRWVIAAIALVIILGFVGKDISNYYRTGHYSVLGFGMSFGLFLLWLWRISFKYTLILYKDRTMEIIQHGFGYKSSYIVDLRNVQTYADKYSRSFFRKTGISQYVHRYDSLDGNKQHLLVVTKSADSDKMIGVLFKSTDKFVRNMKKQFPDHYIDM